MDNPSDVDPVETREWLEALEGVLEVEGAERLHFLLEQLMGEARAKGARVPYSATTAYLNTIPPDRERRTRATGRSSTTSARSSAGTPGDRAARQQGEPRARRPHRQLPVGGHALRHRLHAFLARAHRGATAAI